MPGLLGSGDTSLEIVIKAKDEASRVISGVRKDIDNFKGKVKDLSPTFKKMSAVGVASFTAIAVGAKKVLEEGIESVSIEQSFDRMTKQIGLSGDDLIEKLEEVSKSTVTTTDLMLSSNRAMALGVGNSIDDIATLMEIARVKGQNMGLDTTQAFNDIVTGIGRGSPLILDNLGIVIKQAEAQERYAEQLGKTTDELTDAEKSQAIFNAVLESGKKELAELGDVALTPAERMQQLSAQFANARSELGEKLIPIVEKMADALIPIIERVTDWIEKNPELTKNLVLIAGAVSAVVAVVGALGLVLPAVITGFTILLGPVGLVIAAVGLLTAAIVWLIKHWDELKEQVTFVWDYMSNKWNETVLQIGDGLNIMVAEFQEKVESVKQKWTQTWESMKDTLSSIWQDIKDVVKESIDWIKEKIDNVFQKIENFKNKVTDAFSSIKTFTSNTVSSVGSKLGFQHGGIVPGPVGQPVPILAHGQERVIPASSARSDSSGNFNVVINNPTVRSDGDIIELRRQVERALRSVMLNNKMSTT